MTSRWIVLCFALGACGEARGTSGFNNDTDAETDTGNTPVDTGSVAPVDTGIPAFDAGNPLPQDTGNPFPQDTGNPGFDAGNPVSQDTGIVPPRDTGNGPVDTGVLPPPDLGNSGICPPSCQTASDCNPCRSPGDPPGSNYCCMSGLCLFMSGVCAPPTTVDAGSLPTDVDLNFGDLGDTGP